MCGVRNIKGEEEGDFLSSIATRKKYLSSGLEKWPHPRSRRETKGIGRFWRCARRERGGKRETAVARDNPTAGERSEGSGGRHEFEDLKKDIKSLKN